MRVNRNYVSFANSVGQQKVGELVTSRFNFLISQSLARVGYGRGVRLTLRLPRAERRYRLWLVRIQRTGRIRQKIPRLGSD